MALVSCPDCGTQVSDSAPTCPRCGRPMHAGPVPGLPGASQPPGPYPMPPNAGGGAGAAAAKGLGVGMILLIVLGAVIAVVGILAVLAIFGVRKYIANAKTAEAKNAVSFIAKDAVTAYEANGHLCASASSAVPANRSAVSGKKYQSSSADWQKDAAKDAGFACLKFEMTAPQYYQYEYTATATGFTVTAHGDLNGNGKFSTFEITGKVQDGHVIVSPAINETNPEE